MKYKYPVNYIAITQYFGSSHKGLDLGWNSKHGGKNQPIYASADGTVYSIKDNDTTGKSWGNYVKISHGDNNYTLYAHLKQGLKVKKGQNVKQGDLLGYMGNTGKSSGNHLHFEIYEGGSETKYRIDPLKKTYVYESQKISSNASAIKGLLYFKESNIAKPVEKNNNYNQIKVLAKELRIRKEPNTNSEKLGVVETNGIYNFFETFEDEKYTWYKIANEQWVADNGSYLEIYIAKNFEEEIKILKEDIEKLNSRIIELETENKTLIENQQNYNFLYTAPSDGMYKIQLKKGEILIIKEN